jgi:hypothetical protein
MPSPGFKQIFFFRKEKALPKRNNVIDFRVLLLKLFLQEKVGVVPSPGFEPGSLA